MVSTWSPSKKELLGPGTGVVASITGGMGGGGTFLSALLYPAGCLYKNASGSPNSSELSAVGLQTGATKPGLALHGN